VFSRDYLRFGYVIVIGRNHGAPAAVAKVDAADSAISAHWLCPDNDYSVSKYRNDEDCVCTWRVKLRGQSLSDTVDLHLPFYDRVHEFDAFRQDAPATKVLEIELPSDWNRGRRDNT
jgi:hypothetical protein